jgi:hypothetical protein
VAIKVEACDTWFSKCVRKRANWKCEACGNTETLQCSHIVGRRVKSVRWDGMNATCLCAACHRKFTEHPLDHVRWLEKHLGRQHLAILQEKRNTLLKTTKQLRREIAAHYREQFNTMEDGDEFESWS